MRFGLTGERPYTLEEVGRAFNVTRERIRQIENHTLKKLEALPEAQRLRDASQALSKRRAGSLFSPNQVSGRRDRDEASVSSRSGSRTERSWRTWRCSSRSAAPGLRPRSSAAARSARRSRTPLRGSKLKRPLHRDQRRQEGQVRGRDRRRARAAAGRRGRRGPRAPRASREEWQQHHRRQHQRGHRSAPRPRHTRGNP